MRLPLLVPPLRLPLPLPLLLLRLPLPLPLLLLRLSLPLLHPAWLPALRHLNLPSHLLQDQYPSRLRHPRSLQRRLLVVLAARMLTVLAASQAHAARSGASVATLPCTVVSVVRQRTACVVRRHQRLPLGACSVPLPLLNKKRTVRCIRCLVQCI